MEYIHKVGIVHRDIKPNNILINSSEPEKIKIVLADFGLGDTYKEGQLLYKRCGCEKYCAPEIFHNEKYVPLKVDIWSCGVVLYAMVVG